MVFKSLRIFFLLVICRWTCGTNLYANGQEESKSAKNSEQQEILYNVNLDETIERGQISGKQKTRLKFSTKSFSKKVKKYDVFLVLNDELKGVLAEIVVGKISSKKKLAYAKVVRSASVPINSLVKKTIIRLEDLRTVIGNAQIFRSNPIVHLGVGRSSSVMSAANVLTGAKINPIVLSTNYYLEIFAPKSSGIEWLNWLGFRVISSSYTSTTLDLRQARSNTTQNATITGSNMSAELVFQPWFEAFFIHRTAIVIGFMNNVKENVHFSENQLEDSQTDLSLSRKFSSYGFDLGLNPIPNIYTGVLFRNASSHEFTVTDSSLPEQELTGKWQSTTISFYGQLTQGISESFKINVRVVVANRTDRITDAPEIGSGTEHKISDWGSAIEFGLVYAN